MNYNEMGYEEDAPPEAPQARMAERRRHTRHDAVIPTRVDTPSRPKRFGLTRNVSRTGALIGTPSRFRIGERATILFQLGQEAAHMVDGHIVRLEINRGDTTGLWRYLMAVHFKEPLPDGFIVEANDLGY